MKYIQILTLTILVLVLSSCSTSGDNDNQSPFNNRQSSCTNAIGYSGAYWDFANALPVAWPVFPTLQNPGQQFIHSQNPLLGFTIPQGFSATEITNPQTASIGVDVIRNDNGVVFRWIPNSFILQQIASQDILAAQINNFFAFYGFNGTPEVLCSETKQQIIAGIPQEFNARLLRFNGQIAQFWVITTYVAGGTSFAISVTTAPENEYETQVLETFLPLNFQLYVDPNGNIVDNDGDGFNVLVDPNDNDPNVP